MQDKLTKKTKKPLVSIIIPFYNRENFLGEAVGSVLAQTEKDWELLLVDDGSTDRSKVIARTFVEKYPNKIRLLSHKENINKGASAARNLGIVNAAGEFITFLDSDDVFFSDTLARELRAFAENPDADAVCGTLECWYSWSDEADKRERDFTIDLVLETEKLYRPPALLVHNLRAGGRKPGINCVMLKSDFVRRFGLFEADYRYAWEDQVFWAKVCLHGKIFVLDAVLAKYRQHPASTCSVESRSGKDIISMNIFLEWLAAYLTAKKIENPEVWRALTGFQRTLRLETKLRKIKTLYRRLVPLHWRYRLRDKWTRFKGIG